MKRNLTICAALAFSFLGGTAAKADQLRIDLVMRDCRLSRPDAAIVATVSAALHFGDRDVVYWARDCGRPVRDLGPAYVISYYTHEPVERVWRERRGRDWYDYGIDCGIDWGRFNRLDVSYSDFDRMIWLNLSSTAYGCDVPLWDDLYGQGLGFDDVILTIVLGDGRRDRCDYYAYEYRHYDRDWARWWTAAGRDPHLWVGYRDGDWRNGGGRSFNERSRDLQVQDRQDRQWQSDRNRQEQDRVMRDRQAEDRQDRQWQSDRNRQAQDRTTRDRQSQDRQDRQWQSDRNRETQDRNARDRQVQDRQSDRNRQTQDRSTRDRQVQDRQDRQHQDSRDSGRSRQDSRGDRSNDRSRGEDRGSRDRSDSGNHGH